MQHATANPERVRRPKTDEDAAGSTAAERGGDAVLVRPVRPGDARRTPMMTLTDTLVWWLEPGDEMTVAE